MTPAAIRAGRLTERYARSPRSTSSISRLEKERFSAIWVPTGPPSDNESAAADPRRDYPPPRDHLGVDPDQVGAVPAGPGVDPDRSEPLLLLGRDLLRHAHNEDAPSVVQGRIQTVDLEAHDGVLQSR